MLLARQNGDGESAVNALKLQSTRIIDLHNPIDAEMPAADEAVDEAFPVEASAERQSDHQAEKRREKASRLPKLMRRKAKARKEQTVAEGHPQQPPVQQVPPKSPLLSMAHSVKVSNPFIGNAYLEQNFKN